jgi:hypothetical protein
MTFMINDSRTAATGLPRSTGLIHALADEIKESARPTSTGGVSNDQRSG